MRWIGCHHSLAGDLSHLLCMFTAVDDGGELSLDLGKKKKKKKKDASAEAGVGTAGSDHSLVE